MADESHRSARLSGPAVDGQRTPYQVDRDRLLYSMPFRRLAGVTQVISPGEEEVFHNRLTHSLKVAQVARRFAEHFQKTQRAVVEAWGGCDPDVCEAAALAHDLGHPPFGHIAETEIGRQLTRELTKESSDPKPKSSEGYEGNAQSFRIITELAVRRDKSQYGLDLTRATLNATLKYPWGWQKNPKKPDKYGYYGCDTTAFAFARDGFNNGWASAFPFARSLEAQVMDWADDITYSVHDNEDFYRAGLIPLDRLATNPKERDHFKDNLMARAERSGRRFTADRDFNRAFSGLFDTLRIRAPYDGAREQQELLYDFTSTNIDKFVKATQLLSPPGDMGEALKVREDVKTEVSLLKELIWTYVIENPALASHQLGQRRAIRSLFEVFNRAIREQDWRLFPPFFRQRAILLHDAAGGKGMAVTERVRLAADTVSSLTDRQALVLFQQFSGLSSSSMIDPVFR